MRDRGEGSDRAPAQPTLPPELDPRRPPGAGSRRWIGVSRVLAAVLSLVILTSSGYAWASYQRFASGLTRVDAIPGSSQPGHKDVDGPAQNILLVGDDHRPANASRQELALLSTGQDGGGTNTDTMMLLHLPAHGGAPTVISFPRDSWVDIPGFGKGKLNSAFADGATSGGGDTGGMRLLINTVQTMTGLTIDHFVRVSMVGFYDIASALGPIQVCLNQPARDSYSGTDLPAGTSTLNAKQALSFVRQRHHLLRGDLDREVRQQYFLSAELHKVISAGTLLNPMKQQQLLGAVSSALETDQHLDLLSLATEFQSLSADKVTYATIPVAGTPTITDANGNPVSIVKVDFAAIPAFIARILGNPEAASPTAPPAAPSPATINPGLVTVRVVNGTGRTGLAGTNTAALTQLGFHTEPPANGAIQRATTLLYPAGMRTQAQTVAAHVPGASLLASSSVGQVTLTLGTDGAQVSAATAPAPTTATAQQTAAPTRAFTAQSCIN